MAQLCELPWMSGTDALNHIMHVRNCDEWTAFVWLQNACRQRVVAVQGLSFSTELYSARGLEPDGARQQFIRAMRPDEFSEFRNTFDANYEFYCEDIMATPPRPGATLVGNVAADAEPPSDVVSQPNHDRRRQSDQAVREFFRQRVISWPEDKSAPSENEDFKAAKATFADLTRVEFRSVRTVETPEEWRKQGPRKPWGKAKPQSAV
jgi:hypothetical protein